MTHFPPGTVDLQELARTVEDRAKARVEYKLFYLYVVVMLSTIMALVTTYLSMDVDLLSINLWTISFLAVCIFNGAQAPFFRLLARVVYRLSVTDAKTAASIMAAAQSRALDSLVREENELSGAREYLKNVYDAGLLASHTRHVTSAVMDNYSTRVADAWKQYVADVEVAVKEKYGTP
jgi:hypothetical protein